MAKVRRGNVYLTISDSEVDRYISKGYSLVGKNGEIVKQAIPTELHVLQRAYRDHVETINSLQAKICHLEDLLRAAGDTKKSPAAPKGKKSEEPEEIMNKPEEESWDEWADAEEVEEKPKKSKKSKN